MKYGTQNVSTLKGEMKDLWFSLVRHMKYKQWEKSHRVSSDLAVPIVPN